MEEMKQMPEQNMEEIKQKQMPKMPYWSRLNYRAIMKKAGP